MGEQVGKLWIATDMPWGGAMLDEDGHWWEEVITNINN